MRRIFRFPNMMMDAEMPPEAIVRMNDLQGAERLIRGGRRVFRGPIVPKIRNTAVASPALVPIGIGPQILYGRPGDVAECTGPEVSFPDLQPPETDRRVHPGCGHEQRKEEKRDRKERRIPPHDPGCSPFVDGEPKT